MSTYTLHISSHLWVMHTELHAMHLNKCEFCEKRCSESSTLILNVNDILNVYSTFLSDLDEIRHMKCP